MNILANYTEAKRRLAIEPESLLNSSPAMLGRAVGTMLTFGISELAMTLVADRHANKVEKEFMKLPPELRQAIGSADRAKERLAAALRKQADSAVALADAKRAKPGTLPHPDMKTRTWLHVQTDAEVIMAQSWLNEVLANERAVKAKFG